MNSDETVEFPNRLTWRRWLAANHAEKDGLWLIIYKKHAGKFGLTYQDALEEAIIHGWIDGKLKRIDGEKHMIRFTPRRQGSIWSRINREKAERLIAQGKMTPTGHAKIEEAKKAGLWDTVYTNKRKERIPTDLKTALQSNHDAWLKFQTFANSYRNTYIRWIKDAKTQETRTRRIRRVVERTMAGKKPGEN